MEKVVKFNKFEIVVDEENRILRVYDYNAVNSGFLKSIYKYDKKLNQYIKQTGVKLSTFKRGYGENYIAYS